MNIDTSNYKYSSSALGHHHAYLLPEVLRTLDGKKAGRVFDLGCGNGSTAFFLSKHGYQLSGVDPFEDGIRLANESFPELNLEIGSAYDDLASRFGQFPAVVSLEVVEHVYQPRDYAKTLFSLVAPGGLAIVSTPYHGYLKNLALAASGKMDAHFTALWDNGHIKFWSRRTLRILLEEVGFSQIQFMRVGRIPHLAKSMIAVARRP